MRKCIETWDAWPESTVGLVFRILCEGGCWTALLQGRGMVKGQGSPSACRLPHGVLGT